MNVHDLRRIMYGLRPPALDELGLAGSSREQIGRLGARHPRWPSAWMLPARA